MRNIARTSLLLSLFIVPACKKDPVPVAAPPADTAPAAAADTAAAPTAEADTQPAPAPDTQPAPDAQPAPAADAQAAAADAPPSPADAAAAIAIEALNPLYAPLFKDEAAVFAWTYEVDTHDAEAEDPVAKMSATLTCRSAVTTMAEARIAQVTCEVSDKKDMLDIAPALDGVWIATAAGLWRTGSTPDDAAGLAEILKTKPFLAAVPQAFTDERPADPDKDIAASSTTVAQDGDMWCHTDATEGMYGPINASWCFTAGKGLTKAEMAGRSGPSDETYTRK
jgi:hypothetical protein